MSLIDAVASLAILGFAIAAGLQTYGAAAAGQTADRETAIATELAAALAAEIRAQAFEEPDDTPVFGPEGYSTNRLYYDDVDDYHNYTASPPQNRAGEVLTDYVGYTQQVAVTQGSGASADLKTITVMILKDGKARAEVTFIRSRNDAE